MEKSTRSKYRFDLYIPVEYRENNTYERATILSDREGVSLSEFICKSVNEAIERAEETRRATQRKAWLAKAAVVISALAVGYVILHFTGVIPL